MLKALIALSSDDLCDILKDHLECRFSITCCRDGQTALQLLKDLHPEILILDLSLPLLDGITLLERAEAFRPPIILATIDLDNDYVRDASEDVGIGYIIKLPGDINAMITRLLDMVNHLNKTKRHHEVSKTQAAKLLLALDFATNLHGYLYLQAALPMFADDPSQQMSKELYADIAKMLGAPDHKAVERSIRSAIEDAWMRRDKSVWNAYFTPGTVTRAKGPSNKQFISRMAQELNK